MRLLGITASALVFAGFLAVEEGLTYLELLGLSCIPVIIDGWVKWRIAHLQVVANLLASTPLPEEDGDEDEDEDE